MQNFTLNGLYEGDSHVAISCNCGFGLVGLDDDAAIEFDTLSGWQPWDAAAAEEGASILGSF
jgi:hypothetical protein